MTATRNERLVNEAGLVRHRREALKVSATVYSDGLTRFVRDAKAEGWSNRRIGNVLGLSESYIRKFWGKAKRRADRLP